jgi:hypothetical protein
MIMRYLRHNPGWFAPLSVATGTAFIIALLYATYPRSYAIAVETALTIAVVSLSVGALVIYFAMRRLEIALASPGSPGDRPAADSAACSSARCGILDERLKIDEAHLCSQYMIPCTCWSFCAGSGAKRRDGAGTSPADQKVIRILPLSPEAKDLPLVYRRGMVNCPFRFASPLARPESPDGAAQNSDQSGSGTR